MRILPVFGGKSPKGLAMTLIARFGAAPIAHFFRIYCKELVPGGDEIFISRPVRDLLEHCRRHPNCVKAKF